MEFKFDEIMSKIGDTAKNIGDKATDLAKRAKLSAELGSERNALKDAYAELGKALFDTLGEELSPEIEEKVAKVKLSLELIASKESELEGMRTAAGDSIRVEINKEDPEMEKKLEDVKEKIAAGVEAVKEKAGELSEKGVAAAKDLYEKGTQKVEELKTKLAETEKAAAEETAEVVEEVQETVEEVAEDAAEAVEEAVEAAEEAVEEKKDEE